MNFSEAIEYIQKNPGKKITREKYLNKLFFDSFTDYLTIEDLQGNTLSPYVIHSYDFDYEWKVTE